MEVQNYSWFTVILVRPVLYSVLWTSLKATYWEGLERELQRGITEVLEEKKKMHLQGDTKPTESI